MSGRATSAIGAVLALALAAALLLLAVDVRRWERAMRRADVQPLVRAADGAWAVSETVPFHVARRLLDVDDDIAFRQAARLFRLSRPGIGNSVTAYPQVEFRAEAEVVLGQLKDTEPSSERRSRVANMLGILAFEDAQADLTQTRAPGLLMTSIDLFREAILLDRANADAKFNLQLLLMSEGEELPPANSTRGPRTGGGAGAGTIGSRRGEGY